MTKKCSFCSSFFKRKKKYSDSQWETSSFCSRSCSSKSFHQKRGNFSMSEETKLKISLSNRGKTKNFSEQHKQNIRKSFTLEKRKEIAVKHTGTGNPNWRGGKTPEILALRMTNKYKEWRSSVFKRDNFTCVTCGDRNVVLNADHILPFATFPDLRFDIDNGRTLCVPCHKLTPTYGSSKKNQKLVINWYEKRT